MDFLSLDEVVKAVNGQMILRGRNKKVQGVSIDSRNVSEGDLFFAIQGKRFNGHQFINKAYHAGAAGAVISRRIISDFPDSDFSIIRVNDTITALGDLAQYYRLKLNAKIIGITGSNGKTTTKEMVYYLLSHISSVVKPQKSFNNFIGVPLTIFKIGAEHEYGILEMGTNSTGEMPRLSGIGTPDIAAILNISKTHLDGLGNIEGVASEKAGILDKLREDGVFIYNGDDAWCCKIADNFKGNKISFGFSPGVRIRCTGVRKKENGYAFVINKQTEVYIPVPGFHNIYNCLAAFAICHALGLDINCLKDELSSFQLPDMRMECKNIGNITFINDSYNANPESVYAALKHLGEIDTTGRKIFVCGDMLELGKESLDLHKETGRLVSRLNVDILWTVGKQAHEIASEAEFSGMPPGKISCFMNIDDITEYDMNGFQENDVILIKGSRRMRMERILDRFRMCLSNDTPVYNYF